MLNACSESVTPITSTTPPDTTNQPIKVGSIYWCPSAKMYMLKPPGGGAPIACGADLLALGEQMDAVMPTPPAAPPPEPPRGCSQIWIRSRLLKQSKLVRNANESLTAFVVAAIRAEVERRRREEEAETLDWSEATTVKGLVGHA